MAERGVTVMYETIRAWCYKFGRDYAKRDGGVLFRSVRLGADRQWPPRFIFSKSPLLRTLRGRAAWWRTFEALTSQATGFAGGI
jgi:hypothetical protein